MHTTIISRCFCYLSVLRSLTLCPVLSQLSLSYTRHRYTHTYTASVLVCVSVRAMATILRVDSS